MVKYESVSYHFLDQRQCLHNFPTAVYLAPSCGGLRWHFLTALGFKNKNDAPTTQIVKKV